MGGGSDTFSGRSSEQLARQVREAEDQALDAAFETRLADQMTGMLSEYNARDVDLVQERLTEILDSLDEELDDECETLFGGSVSKHTYVDGLSDVDTLVVLNDPALVAATPAEALAYLEAKIQSVVTGRATVSTGTLAVTVEYEDGMKLQLLPATRAASGIRIADSTGPGWSSIHPDRFCEALAGRNRECNGKLVPMIKLAKAINYKLPASLQLTGYHIESLAIAAFRDYGEVATMTKMLPHFFSRSAELVLAPITDRTGQSVHVDGYLGDARSSERQQRSHLLAQVAKRMRSALLSSSEELWLSLFPD
jgi:hypothetical protein